MTVLEIGCGLGHTAAWLASRGLDVVAIDFSWHIIRRAMRMFPHQPGLVFKTADVCGANAPTSTFDVLIDSGCLQGLPDALHLRYKRNLLLWSRPGTRFVVPMHTLNAPFHERLAQVQSLFCPPFEVVHVEESPSSTGGPPKPVIHLVRRNP
jgi:protein-L-isoaspartate O-methyltransferase